MDSVDEDVALGRGGCFFAGLLAPMAPYGIDDLCFGELIVSTADLLQRGEDVQKFFGCLVFAKYLDDILVNA